MRVDLRRCTVRAQSPSDVVPHIDKHWPKLQWVQNMESLLRTKLHLRTNAPYNKA